MWKAHKRCLNTWIFFNAPAQYCGLIEEQHAPLQVLVVIEWLALAEELSLLGPVLFSEPLGSL